MLRAAIFILALLAGGAAAWLSAGASRTAALDVVTGEVTAGVATQDVLVATVDIVPGASVEQASLRWQPWPQDAVNLQHITRTEKPDATESLSGMKAQSAIFAGEPVHEGKLVTGDAGVLSIMLASGNRAVAVRINAENTAGGFILPNDRVDVLHTRTHQGTNGQSDASSRTILRNVRVLAIDQTIDSANGSVVGKTATLELAPEDAETVMAAEASGAVTLALRSLTDADEPAEETVAAAPAAKVVRVFRGGQQELVEVN